MDWYEKEVEELIQQRDKIPYQPQTVFYGSSTIRLWETLYKDFKEYLPVNLGFGGSTLEACIYFFNRIVAPVQTAQKIVMYAGDNDLGDGKSPEEVVALFIQLQTLLATSFFSVPFYFISIKPSISRWNINDNIISVNESIKDNIKDGNNNMTFINIYNSMLGKNDYPVAEYYDADGLHLSAAGYEVWKQILLAQVFDHK